VNIIELAKENCPYRSEEMRGAYYDGFVRAATLVRAEALEEAAKVCDDYDMDHIVGQQLAAAIRELK
jgi:hypothetical protein